MKNILVATDFSATSTNAVNAAIELCKEHDATLHLLHVVESYYITSVSETEASSASITTENDQNAREQLYHIYQAILRVHNISVQIHMPFGIPCDEICKTAEEMPIDLVLMGKPGPRKFFMSTTTYGVIKKSARPVLTIPAECTTLNFERILFPVQPKYSMYERFQLAKSFLCNKEAKIFFAELGLEGHQQSFELKENLANLIGAAKIDNKAYTHQFYSCPNYCTKLLELGSQEKFDLMIINTVEDCREVNNARIPVLSFNHDLDDMRENCSSVQDTTAELMVCEGL